MKYIEAINFLNDIKKYGSVPGLDSIKRLLEALGNPQEKLRVIHIAGTNGKGSILAMLESVLSTSGYTTGRYHSPQLFDVREAFQVNTQWISEEDLLAQVEKVKEAARNIEEAGFPHPTSFEVETAIAFSYFCEKKVDVVLLETGMGGRLDATNIIKKPLVEILASISMDHMQFLGDTLEAIATEKAGIIKEGTDVVLYPSGDTVYKVVEKEAKEKNARLTMANAEGIHILSSDLSGQSFSYRTADGHYYSKITIPLLGEHQIYNAITVIEVLEHLKKYFCMGVFEIEEGLRRTYWPGRLEVIGHHPVMIRDGAHNEDAALRLADFMEKNFTNKRIFYIMGVLKDKEYDKILRTMSPYCNDFYAVESDSPRALKKELLAEAAAPYYENVFVVGSVEETIKTVMEKASSDDVILIFGSLSFMKDIEEAKKHGTIPKGSEA
ncbi:MAG: bifunctional folylpolyglutamate synthase/dihydrofolate synthase [Lachnospiraceae bacterium]|nr:bifunctional folylpolyglutamate synthase/dihydrofolate synthase [Lachnospiraceae bacterium]